MILALAVSGLAIAAAVPAAAQDVVVMRRVLIAPTKRFNNTTPLPGPSATPTPSPAATPTPTPGTPTPGTPTPTPMPTPTPTPVYSYGWKQTVGDWSSTCSRTATRTNAVSCLRSDGAVAADNLCNSSTKPSTSDTQDVSTSCTYTPTYGAPTTCTSNTPGSTSGSQTVTVTSCMRSDNTIADNALCSPTTKTLSCRPDNTSDQYARLAGALSDTSKASSQSVAYRNQSNPITGSSYKFAVVSTLCWDSVNNKIVADATCSALAYGANVYDLLAVPATYVAGLHEVYVQQADILAANQRNGLYYNVNNATTNVPTICSTGAPFSVNNSGNVEIWQMRCGTPDSVDHYQRRASELADAASTFMPAASQGLNVSTNATFAFGVASTICYDTSAKAAAASTKCAYISGPNIYDIATVPATYVPNLREVYVQRADVQAAMPFGYSIRNTTNYSVTLNDVCGSTGLPTFVTVSGRVQGWTLRCGTPASADHYQRRASELADVASTFMPAASQGLNVSTNATFAFGVVSTMCYDTSAKAAAASTKCAYISGPNIYDIATVPATYVPDLREVYVQRADVQAAMPSGYSIRNTANYSVTLNDVCGSTGLPTFVTVNGRGQSWTLRCGAPDNSAHYQRLISQLIELSNPYMPVGSRALNVSTASQYKFGVSGTTCYDTTAKTAAATLKCSYITGANLYDLVSVPATYVPDLREVYVQQADVQAALPVGGSFVNSFSSSGSITAMCGGTATYVTAGSQQESWTLRCGTADTPGHYQRQAGSISDPISLSSLPTASKLINTPSASTLTLGIRSTLCWDTAAANVAVVTTKCNYLPNGSNVNDLVTVPATYVSNLREVYVQQADLQALMPNANYLTNMGGTGYSLSQVCSNPDGINFNVTVGGASQTWKLRCGAPDTSNYTRHALRLIDPAVYGGTTAVKATNATSKSTLSMLVDSTIGCWNLTSGTTASSAAKCSYITSGPQALDLVSVAATWNVAATTVTIAKSDLLASAPYVPTTAFTGTGTVCSGTKWQVGGVSYTVVCQ